MRFVPPMLVALATRAYADAHHDAEQQAATAANLARDGHCREAVALRSRIDALDHEVAMRVFSADPTLAACAATAPVPSPSDDAPIRPPPGHCDNGAYLNPSLTVGTGRQALVLTRISLGVAVRSCDSSMMAAVGVTGFAGAPGVGGFGGELEISRWTHDATRIGGHLSLESLGGDGYMASLDLRYHIEELGWIGAGAYGASNTFGEDQFGATLTFGVEGKPGAAIAGVELGVGALFGLFVLAALAHSH